MSTVMSADFCSSTLKCFMNGARRWWKSTGMFSIPSLHPADMVTLASRYLQMQLGAARVKEGARWLEKRHDCLLPLLWNKLTTQSLWLPLSHGCNTSPADLWNGRTDNCQTYIQQSHYFFLVFSHPILNSRCPPLPSLFPVEVTNKNVGICKIKEASIMKLLGCHDELFPLMTLRASPTEKESSCSTTKVATTAYPWLVLTHKKNSGRAYLVVLEAGVNWSFQICSLKKNQNYS
ncbi:uncharacterized protein [Haliotis cracherodii]|uniref:uncharacterized protein n=1 Tax=Haliotis cracherodii TaxID=6455 RepID=UPI0039ED7D6D